MTFLIINWPNFVLSLVDPGFLPTLKFLWRIALRSFPIGYGLPWQTQRTNVSVCSFVRSDGVWHYLLPEKEGRVDTKKMVMLKIQMAKAKAYNTYIEPTAATAAAAALFYHRHNGLRPAIKQPYAALVCRLMVSTPVIHVIRGTIELLFVCIYTSKHKIRSSKWIKNYFFAIKMLILC